MSGPSTKPTAMPRITYTSDQPAEYGKALDGAKSLPELVAILKDWESLAADALAIGLQMTEADFQEWKAGLVLERKGEFAGEEYAEKYGALNLPEVLIKVSMLAANHGAPWGCAYLRLKETGNLERFLA